MFYSINVLKESPYIFINTRN